MTGPTPTSRRTLLAAAALSPVPVLLGGSRALATAYVVQAPIAATYARAGGAKVLGAPTADQIQVAIGGRSTYGQRFEHGQVWWGSGVGKADVPLGARVRLDTGTNFRPVLGTRAVYRSNDLDGCSALEQRIVRDLLISTVIAMDEGSDPAIAGVRNLSYVISNDGSHLAFYRGYVSRPASRKAIGHVLSAVATSTRPVLLHCAAGKDRTGWTSDLLATLAGVSRKVRDADYLATKRYSGGSVDLDWLNAARNEMGKRYGSIVRYLTVGCGLSKATLSTLTRRVKP